jgi:hypothetical protein
LRRIMMAVSLVAMLTFTTVPALADDRDDSWNDRWNDRQEERFFDGFFSFDDFDRLDDRFFNDGFDGDLNQDFEQEAESGDVDQSFDVSQTGDNSNQCVGIQGVANTGNAQNQLGLTQFGQEGDFDDFDRDGFFFDNDRFDRFDREAGDVEFEDVGSTIEVSPEASTTCDQQINQAATASGK